jgi:multidrug resistance protein, MATE family
VRLCLAWGFVLAGLATAALLIFGDPLIAFITTAQDVRAAASAYLPWAALTAVTAVLAFQMDGVFIGAAWSRDLRNMMLLSLTAFIAALLPLTPAFGNHGLWAALHIFLLARGLSLLVILRLKLKTAF